MSPFSSSIPILNGCVQFLKASALDNIVLDAFKIKLDGVEDIVFTVIFTVVSLGAYINCSCPGSCGTLGSAPKNLTVIECSPLDKLLIVVLNIPSYTGARPKILLFSSTIKTSITTSASESISPSSVSNVPLIVIASFSK